MAKKLTERKVMEALDWTYDKAINGVLGLDSAEELAASYADSGQSPTKRANALIRSQIVKAGTSGFLAGLGGLLITPVTVPANLLSVWYVQIRMIAAIAHMGGHHLKDDKVRTLVFTCLAENAAKDILKDMGIVVGKQLSKQAVKAIPSKAIVAINQAVVFRLLTKFGEKGAGSLGKAIPLIGGVIGGTFDSVSTNTIGNVARDTFIGKK